VNYGTIIAVNSIFVSVNYGTIIAVRLMHLMSLVIRNGCFWYLAMKCCKITHKI